MACLIAAVATAPGEGGIAIVRMSGSGAEEALKRLILRKRDIKSHEMLYAHAFDRDGNEIDEVMCCLMRAPKSYTREDVAEIYCHGGTAVANLVLDRVLELGARGAEPGEFTRRAFENGRIDLARAEAVMQLIGADSEAAARAGIRQLSGGASDFVRKATEKLLSVLSLIEASTDFPDEIDEAEAARDVLPQIEEIISDIIRNADPESARIVSEGASIVLAGRPNVGKSSLMNALLCRDRAIVTDIPGTTRDVLTEKIVLGGISATLSDTAGRRDAKDLAEQIGVDMAERALRGSDVAVLVLDGASGLSPDDEKLMREADGKCIVVVNKSDLPRVLSTIPGEITVSAETGEGIEELRCALKDRISGRVSADSALVARRHIALANEAKDALIRGREAILSGMALDAVTMDVKEALDRLSLITGQNATEDVIDRVFRDFCVGK